MKNIRIFLRIFYAHRFFRDFILIYPVYMLLFESKGLSVFEITMLLIIWSIPVFLLEIPSGILADRWSRKRMIVIGTSFKLVTLVLWFSADGFWMFALGFVFWGVMEAFCSGSTEALLFDVLKKYGLDDDYEKTAGRGHFYAGLGVAASMLLGGFAASNSFEPAMLLSIASVIIAVLLALFFEEAHHADELHEGPYKKMLIDGFRQLKHSPHILMLLLFSSLIIIAPGILEEYDQLYADRIGLSIIMIGIWGGIRTGMEALASRLAYKLKNVFNSIGRISFLAIIAGLLLFISVSFYTVILLPVYGLFYMLISGANVLTESMLQRQIQSAQRATVLSVNSLLMNLFSLGLYACFALIANTNLQTAFLFMAVYTMIIAGLFLIIIKIRNKSAA